MRLARPAGREEVCARADNTELAAKFNPKGGQKCLNSLYELPKTALIPPTNHREKGNIQHFTRRQCNFQPGRIHHSNRLRG